MEIVGDEKVWNLLCLSAFGKNESIVTVLLGELRHFVPTLATTSCLPQRSVQQVAHGLTADSSRCISQLYIGHAK
jgi:hypothetical protein